jgi:hypothetical protein
MPAPHLLRALLPGCVKLLRAAANPYVELDEAWHVDLAQGSRAFMTNGAPRRDVATPADMEGCVLIIGHE